MDCGRVRAESLAERYLEGDLDERGRDEFEEHYFACSACFEDLEKLRALQTELARSRARIEVDAAARPRRWHWSWAPAAAVLTVAAVIAWQLVPQQAPEPTPPVWRGGTSGVVSVQITPGPAGSIGVAWGAYAGTRTYVVRVYTSDGARVLERETGTTELVIGSASLPPAAAGVRLLLRVEALDAAGQVVARSELTELPPPRP